MNAYSNPPLEPGTSTSAIQDYLPAITENEDSPRLTWYRSGGLLNERRAHRVAFPERLHVVGLELDRDRNQFITASEAVIGEGRDISVDGISLYHTEHIPHRYVGVSFRSPFGTQTLVAKLLWCRFVRENHYMSGGQLIANPAYHSDGDIDWSRIERSR